MSWVRFPHPAPSGPNPLSGFGLFRFSWSVGAAGPASFRSGGLVAAFGVEGQLADDLAGGGVDDADVEVVDEEGDRGAGVGAADADVEQAPVVAEGDLAGLVDAVVTDPVVAGGVGVGAGFGAR